MYYSSFHFLVHFPYIIPIYYSSFHFVIPSGVWVELAVPLHMHSLNIGHPMGLWVHAVVRDMVQADLFTTAFWRAHISTGSVLIVIGLRSDYGVLESLSGLFAIWGARREFGLLWVSAARVAALGLRVLGY